MRLEITTGGKKQAVVLEGRGTVGGGDDDLIRIEGAPPKLADIWPEGPVWRIRTRMAGKVNGVAFPPHIARVFCAGETVDLGGGTMLLAHVAEVGAVGTAAVLKDFLGEPQAAAPSLPVFICLTGADSGRRLSMVGAEALIGRGELSQLRLRDGSVSRKHAKVERMGSKFWIEDLDSPNGVYVNNRRISRRAVLVDGAVIEVGQTLLRFQAPADNKPSIGSDATPKMPAIAVPPTPVIPVVNERPPKIELVDAEPELVVEEDLFVAVNAPEPQAPRFDLRDKAIVAAGVVMMLLGAGAAVLLS